MTVSFLTTFPQRGPGDTLYWALKGSKRPPATMAYLGPAHTCHPQPS